MRKDRRESLIMATIILALMLVLGYAYLTLDLNIVGGTGVLESNWDIHWNNAVVKSGSVSGSQVIQAPTITNNQTTVSYHIRLKKPGDFYEFTVDAVNAGTIDGMISVMSSTLNGVPISTLPAYLNYSVTYYDGINIAQNQILPANSTEIYKVRLEYKEDVQASDLPTAAQTLSLTFSVNYVQADSAGVDVRFYNFFDGYAGTTKVGTRISSRIPLYPTYQSVLDTYNRDLFIREGLTNHIVEEAYIGIVKNGEVFYLRGVGATYIGTGGYNNCGYDEDSPYFADNIEVLNSLFNSNVACAEYVTSPGRRYYCSNSEYTIIAYANGNIVVNSLATGNRCEITSAGTVCCGSGGCGSTAKGAKNQQDDEKEEEKKEDEKKP